MVDLEPLNHGNPSTSWHVSHWEKNPPAEHCT
jgi:hypothetical protein